LRVIAGSAKGAKLKAPKGATVRPTADRVKEALFSILGSRVGNSLFLDLYAGSGAVGIEALSRGSSFCIFVDNRKKNLAVIRENLAKTRFADRSRLINADVEKTASILAREGVKADLVYLDPPYNHSDIGPVINIIFKKGIVAENSLLIIEHSYSSLQRLDEFNIFRQKKYGDTWLTFILKPDRVTDKGSGTL